VVRVDFKLLAMARLTMDSGRGASGFQHDTDNGLLDLYILGITMSRLDVTTRAFIRDGLCHIVTALQLIPSERENDRRNI
jgi:hypothetical protein